MKYVKYLVVAFVVTSIMAMTGVNAATPFRNYVGFKLPAWSGTVDGGTLNKTDYDKHVIGVLSTQDTRDFYVRLTGKGISGATGTSPWVLVEVFQNSDSTDYSTVKKFSTETSAEAYGMVPGNVTITMKARNNYLSSTWLNGTWFVSETIYNQIQSAKS